MQWHNVTDTVIQKLLGNGSEAIQYQVTLALEDFNQQEKELQQHKLIQSEDIQKLLEAGKKLVQKRASNTIHGGNHNFLENILPMLLDRGVNASFPAFDQTFTPLLEQWYPTDFITECHSCPFEAIVLSPFLFAAGYRNKPLIDFILQRLDLVSTFCGRMDFDLFGDQKEFKGIPKSFQNRKVIRPDLYVNGNYQFPLIYDLYVYRALYPEASPDQRTKVDMVLRYLLADEYQKFPHGYGLLKVSTENHTGARYHSMGWDAILPEGPEGNLTAPVLHRMELLAPFPQAVASPWFQKYLSKLHQFRQEDDMYLLPKSVLPEKDTYWVLGGHMGLGENRKKKTHCYFWEPSEFTGYWIK